MSHEYAYGLTVKIALTSHGGFSWIDMEIRIKQVIKKDSRGLVSNWQSKSLQLEQDNSHISVRDCQEDKTSYSTTTSSTTNS